MAFVLRFDGKLFEKIKTIFGDKCGQVNCDVFMELSTRSFIIDVFLKGALFFENEVDLEKTFEATIDRVNDENAEHFKLIALMRRLSPGDGSIALESAGFSL